MTSPSPRGAPEPRNKEQDTGLPQPDDPESVALGQAMNGAMAGVLSPGERQPSHYRAHVRVRLRERGYDVCEVPGYRRHGSITLRDADPAEAEGMVDWEAEARQTEPSALRVCQHLDLWARDIAGQTSIPTDAKGLDQLLYIVEQARAALEK